MDLVELYLRKVNFDIEDLLKIPESEFNKMDTIITDYNRFDILKCGDYVGQELVPRYRVPYRGTDTKGRVFEKIPNNNRKELELGIYHHHDELKFVLDNKNAIKYSQINKQLCGFNNMHPKYMYYDIDLLNEIIADVNDIISDVFDKAIADDYDDMLQTTGGVFFNPYYVKNQFN